jgi:hypothetical protein
MEFLKTYWTKYFNLFSPPSPPDKEQLSLTYDILKAHDGEIRVETEGVTVPSLLSTYRIDIHDETDCLFIILPCGGQPAFRAAIPS